MFVCLFLFEDLPNYLIILGIISHANNILILRTFPFFKLTSIPFIAFIGKQIDILSSILYWFKFLFLISVFVIVNHYLTFNYFAHMHYHFTQVMEIPGFFVEINFLYF